MLPAFPNVTTQIELNNNDVDLDDLKSSVLSNKLIMLKWIQTTENQLKDEIKKTKNIILTESKREINYVDEILKEKLKLNNDPNVKRCQFKDEQNNQEQCKRINLPYSNYCNEHISHNKDQQLFKRCSIKLKNNKQCPNSSLTIFDDKEICLKHSNDLKNSENIENNNLDINLINDLKEITKTKRRTNKNGNLNDKPKKTRKKKDNQELIINKNNLTTTINNLESISTNNLINNSTFTCYSTNLTDSNQNFNNFNNSTNTINTTDLIENYVPCLANNNNENLNQLSNLNHSEDSLVAIVNNSDDLPFEESELCNLLGKIPDDAFNDIFMDNLSADCANISFNNSNDDVNNLEPSISLNFKNNTTSTDCFRDNDRTNNLQLNNNSLLFNQNQLELNNDLNQTEMIYLQNNLITTNESIKSLNHFNNNLCSSINNETNIQQSNYNNSFNFLDYKPVQQSQNLQQYSSQLITHSNYSTNNSTSPPNYNSATFLQSNYSSSSSNGHLINNNNNNFQATNSSTTNNLLNDDQNAFTGNSINNLTTNQSSFTDNQSITNKNELQDKKFNLFQENCKTNYSTTYSNIYDDLPAFESINQPNNNNRLNGSSLPSFSMINMIKKNRIESR